MNRVVINARTGGTGDYFDWVEAFAELWSGGRKNLDRFLDVMSPGIRLVAPGFKPTEGWDEGYKAFGRTFEAMPDLTGEVRRWSASGDLLFVEMTFSATVGGKRVACKTWTVSCSGTVTPWNAWRTSIPPRSARRS